MKLLRRETKFILLSENTIIEYGACYKIVNDNAKPLNSDKFKIMVVNIPLVPVV